MRHPKQRPTPKTARPATRFTAALLSGTLALGAVPAPAALAAEADREGEGTAPPALLPASPEDDPDFDPGGIDIPLDPVPETTVEDEEEVELEPSAETIAVTDPATPEPETVIDPAADPGISQPDATVPAEPETSPSSPETELVTNNPGKSTTDTPGRPAPAVKAAAVLVQVAQRQAKQAGATGHKAMTAPASIPAPAQPVPDNPTSETRPDPDPSAAANPSTLATSVTPARSPIRPGTRVYRVQPGDSLWLIAKATLPPGATDAEIAKKVEALWRLNRDRIATGNPDLLPIGVMVKLPLYSA